MNLTDSQKMVADMCRMYQQDTPETMQIPSLEVRKLGAKLMLEECLETICHGLGLIATLHVKNEDGHINSVIIDTADIKNKTVDLLFYGDATTPDLTQIRDGIADQLVVVLGTAVACGINAESDFKEVMRSNFSKMWADEEVWELRMDNESLAMCDIGESLPLQGRLTATRRVYAEPRCWLVKDFSGKVIKSKSYEPANLQPAS